MFNREQLSKQEETLREKHASQIMNAHRIAAQEGKSIRDRHPICPHCGKSVNQDFTAPNEGAKQ